MYVFQKLNPRLKGFYRYFGSVHKILIYGFRNFIGPKDINLT